MISIATKEIDDIILGYEAEIDEHWQTVAKELMQFKKKHLRH